MLIFEFKDDALQASVDFAAACRESGKQAWLWGSQDAMHDAFTSGQDGSDVFPFVIDGIVVTVERDDDDKVERAIEQMVESFGGTYVGT